MYLVAFTLNLAPRPIGGPATRPPIEAALIGAVSLVGYLAVSGISFRTDHFHLFGLRQVEEHAMGRAPSELVFRVRSVCRNVRRPMMLGFLLAFWATPPMTVGHLLFAVSITACIPVGIYFEERSPAAEHWRAYHDRQARVPRLRPWGPPAESPGALEPRAGAACTMQKRAGDRVPVLVGPGIRSPGP